MSNYTGVNKHSWGSGGDALRVGIFAAESASRRELDIAYDAVEDAVSDVYYSHHAENVDNAAVVSYDTSESLPCGARGRRRRASDVRTHVLDWLDDHGFHENGCYLWVTDCPVARGWDGGWSGRAVALVSSDWYRHPSTYLGAMAVQESLHSFITYGCEDVQGRTAGNEHDLGTITADDEVTPMAASYEDTAAYHRNGDCDGRNPDRRSYTEDVSTCTIKAVSDSLAHANSWFHDFF